MIGLVPGLIKEDGEDTGTGDDRGFFQEVFNEDIESGSGGVFVTASAENNLIVVYPVITEPGKGEFFQGRGTTGDQPDLVVAE